MFIGDNCASMDEYARALGFADRLAPGEFLLSLMVGVLVNSRILDGVVVQLGIHNVKFTGPCYAYYDGRAYLHLQKDIRRVFTPRASRIRLKLDTNCVERWRIAEREVSKGGMSEQ